MHNLLSLPRAMHVHMVKGFAVFIIFSASVEASPLFTGKEVCLQMDPPIGWGLSNVNQTFKLQAGKRSVAGIFPLSAVNDYVKTSSGATLHFSDALTGVTRVDVPNGALDTVKKVIIELSGSNRGIYFGSDAVPGIWNTSYSFVLDPQTMVGTMQGIKRFEPTIFGGLTDSKTTIIQDMPIKPVKCGQ